MTLSPYKSFCRVALLASVAAITVSAGQSRADTKNINDLDLASYTVTIGDYVYSGFSFTGFTPGANDTFVTSGTGTGATASTQLALQFDPTRTASTNGSFSYTVTLLNGRDFRSATVGYLGSDDDQTPNYSAPSFQTALTAAGGTFATSGPSIGPSASAGGASSSRNFNPGLTSRSFTQTFGYTAGSASFLNTFNVTLNSNAQNNVPAGTPGPLPLLGAGAAFSFSRKLRFRIKATV